MYIKYWLIVIMSSYYYYPTISPDVTSYYPITLNPDYNNLYGYDMLSQIYANLLNTIDTYPYGYNFRIKPDINQEIKNKLDRLKKAEDDLRDALENAELKKQLQVASRGYIDPNRIPDKYLPAILEKHSNLLGLTGTYNSKVRNLVNILQKINDVVYEKTDGQYGVSMNVSTPTAPSVNIYPPYPPYAKIY
jgi:hypothetical protein